MSKESIIIKPMQDIQAYLKPAQVNNILLAAHGSKGWQRKRDVLLLGLLAYSGRRVGEILNIKIRDIDFEDGRIAYNISKKSHPLKKWKSVNSDVFKLLHEYVYNRRLGWRDYLFPSSWDNRKHITDTRVRQIVYKYALRAGIPDFAEGKHPHPHTFRHSFAVANAKRCKSPADLRRLQMILEHSKIDVTTFYLQFSDADQRDMVEEVYKES